MGLCPECQLKVDALEHAIRCAIDGLTKDVEWNRCTFPLSGARCVVSSYRDYCRRHHGAEVKMFMSHQLQVTELKKAVTLWMWERHGIDAKCGDVSFECVDNELVHVVIEHGPPGDVCRSAREG